MAEIQEQLNPTADIGKYLEKYKDLLNDDSQNYKAHAEVLKRVMAESNKQVLDKYDILLKVILISTFMHTVVLDVDSVARHYAQVKDLNKRLDKGDISLVDELRKVKMADGKVRDFYSLATKFCSRHNEEAFPIYDSLASEMLLGFLNRDEFVSFKKKDLKDYGRYVELYKAFQKHYKLEKYDFRRIDHYLWMLGKELKQKSKQKENKK